MDIYFLRKKLNLSETSPRGGVGPVGKGVFHQVLHGSLGWEEYPPKTRGFKDNWKLFVLDFLALNPSTTRSFPRVIWVPGSK